MPCHSKHKSHSKRLPWNLSNFKPATNLDQDVAEDLQNTTGVKKKSPSSIILSLLFLFFVLTTPRLLRLPRQALKRIHILPLTLDTTIIKQVALSHERLLDEEFADGADNELSPTTMASSYGALPIRSSHWVCSTSSSHSSWFMDGPSVNARPCVVCPTFLDRRRSRHLVDLRANLKRLCISPSGATSSTYHPSLHVA